MVCSGPRTRPRPALFLQLLEALEEQEPGDLFDVIEQAVGVVVLPENLAGLPELSVERFA